MNEIVPGIFHWTVEHPDIHVAVSSHYVAPARMLVDPLEPDDGMGVFDALDAPPEHVVLTSGLHWRHAERFRDRYGAAIRAPAPAADRFSGSGRSFEPFGHEDVLAAGVTALEVGGIAPDDFALHVDVGSGAIVLADAVMRYGGQLGFFPDHLWEDPRTEQRKVLESLRRTVLKRDFDVLLLAHGDPLADGGRAALEAFAGPPDV